MGAGQKAWETRRLNDAHRVRDLYRATFTNHNKMIARGRVIESLRTAGVMTVLDLWGGGLSAEELVAAGFRVIAVEDGSMELTDNGRTVSRDRKRRALEYAAAEGGYEARFGKAENFAAEADGAYLDFCGPWATHTRRAVMACRHMKVVAVTLTPDHDSTSGASNILERQMAFQLFLKMAWSGSATWDGMRRVGNGVRRLLDYRRPRGFAVFVYLLSRKPIRLRPVSSNDRHKTRPDMHQRRLATKRNWYAEPDNRAKAQAKSRKRWADIKADPQRLARFREVDRMRRARARKRQAEAG